MLKFLKIFPFLILCFSSGKAQVDTFYLTNKEICFGKIYKDYGFEFDINSQNGPALISTQKLYKIVKADGSVIKYKDLTYLERGLSKENYRKILKPLVAKNSVFQNLYYGDIHISRRNFFDALEMIQDEEITKNMYHYKRKNTTSHLLVTMGWAFQVTGFLSALLFVPDIHFRNGGIYYYYYESGIVLYASGAMVVAGFTEMVIGYVQAIVAGKIKKRKLIDRYNSLILQP